MMKRIKSKQTVVSCMQFVQTLKHIEVSLSEPSLFLAIFIAIHLIQVCFYGARPSLFHTIPKPFPKLLVELKMLLVVRP